MGVSSRLFRTVLNERVLLHVCDYIWNVLQQRMKVLFESFSVQMIIKIYSLVLMCWYTCQFVQNSSLHLHTILLLCLLCSLAYFPAWSHLPSLVHRYTHILGRLFCFTFFYVFILHRPTETWQQKYFSAAISFILPCMASVRRFGSCSCSKYFQNRKDRSWKCRSVVLECLLVSRIKAQGDDWTRKTVATSQAGVDPLYTLVFAHIRYCVWCSWFELKNRWGFTSKYQTLPEDFIVPHSLIFHGVLVGSSLFGLQISSLSCRPCLWSPKSDPFHFLTA